MTPLRVSACEPLVEGTFTPLVRRQAAKVERAWLNWALAAVLERRAGAVVEAAGGRAVVVALDGALAGEVVAWVDAASACDEGSGAGGAEAPPEAPQAVRVRVARASRDAVGIPWAIMSGARPPSEHTLRALKRIGP